MDLPVRHAFRMFDRLRGERIAARSDQQLSLDEILAKGVRDRPDIGVFTSRDGEKIIVLFWHYHDDDIPGPDADISLTLGLMDGKPAKACREDRVDGEHGNPYKTWLAMGSPKTPSPDEVKQLQAAAASTETHSPKLTVEHDSVRMNIKLPRQSVVLLEFTP